MLSWALQQAGIAHIVIDHPKNNTASRVAPGVINPVTGRRIVKTWMIDELMPHAWNIYQQLGQATGITAIEQKNIVDFFTTPQMKNAFESRFETDQQYLALPNRDSDWQPYFHFDFGYGEIDPVYLVNLQTVLPAYRKLLQQRNQLWEEELDTQLLQVEPGKVQYKDLQAERIIFCDGIAGASNPWFHQLPFSANKGEVVWVEIKDMPDTNLYKKGFALIPWEKDVFWLGSTYLWEFENDQPTPGFRQFADTWLQQTVKLPYKILDHKAAIRPATLERRPFVGFHPEIPAVGILNGMGTKGCSLAPWFAQEMVQQLLTGSPLTPEASVQRFRGVLSRDLSN